MIDWIGSVFTRPPDKEMRGLEWGRLYETYHSNVLQRGQIDATSTRSAATRSWTTPRASTSTCSAARQTSQLLDVRLFDEKTSAPPTSSRPEGEGRRDLELPAVRGRDEREQDPHLQAERDGRRPRYCLVEGRLDGPRQLEMLCVTHNRAKGNK